MIDCWIPELRICDDLAKYSSYVEDIYAIFKRDFIDSSPVFNNAIVDIRRTPYDQGKEDGFWHVTCKDYKTGGPRNTDLRRCERIEWIRAIIENYNCNSYCDDCDGVLAWIEPYKGSYRVHFLLVDERYLVIIEPRKTYYVLVTAFYIDENSESYFRKQLNQYEKYQKLNNAP